MADGGTGTGTGPVPEDGGTPAAGFLPLPDDLRFPGAPAGAGQRAGARAAQEAEYERYFRISRTRPDRDVWTHSLLTAQSALLADLAGTRLTDGERADLLTGLVLLGNAALAGPGGPADPPRTAGPPPGGPAGREDPAAGPPEPAAERPALSRWRIGHQIFHLHLTLMNSLLDEALLAARACEWPRLTGLLDRLCQLYDSATAAMTYAADFGPDAPDLYRRQVRPTMEPPFVSPGFSGMFNREHREMTRLLGAVRRALKRVPATGEGTAEVRAAGARLRAAQARNRANHLRICERCVPDGVSLLREHLDRQDAPPPAEEASGEARS
ncbi:hypothetical protein [Streptomyces johnsoniae]|uniref:Uncharacterized protein n=1 Tax=Streptomyces johnsoniae TaxID=3075532 RepID=A0ABU2SC17_9ACTN|nr:hypothetical protein [Streptomyces sp. DSM 41886]MDT0446522.1 hypothetical protein [Streptomyces sp. DSM 41886]